MRDQLCPRIPSKRPNVNLIVLVSITCLHPSPHSQYTDQGGGQRREMTNCFALARCPTPRTYCKATVTQKVRYLHTDGYVAQWNRMQNSEILESHKYGSLIFGKKCQGKLMRKGSLFNKWS